MKRMVVILLAITLTSLPAFAADWSVYGNVTVLSSTSVPGQFTFQTNVAAGSCAAGSWLTYVPQGPDTTSQQQNSRAVFALLMAAQESGHHVEIIGYNSLNGVSCAVIAVWGSPN